MHSGNSPRKARGASLEPDGAHAHLLAMTHIDLQPYEHSKHPGATRTGNAAFYSFVGMAVVALLVLFGLFLLAQNALVGLAALMPSVPAT